MATQLVVATEGLRQSRRMVVYGCIEMPSCRKSGVGERMEKSGSRARLNGDDKERTIAEAARYYRRACYRRIAYLKKRVALWVKFAPGA